MLLNVSIYYKLSAPARCLVRGFFLVVTLSPIWPSLSIRRWFDGWCSACLTVLRIRIFLVRNGRLYIRAFYVRGSIWIIRIRQIRFC